MRAFIEGQKSLEAPGNRNVGCIYAIDDVTGSPVGVCRGAGRWSDVILAWMWFDIRQS